MADPHNMSIAEQMAANQRAFNREYDERMRRSPHWDPDDRIHGSSGNPSDGWFWASVMVSVPVLLVYFAVSGLVAGTDWLANESLLAPLFPAPGDSVPRYALSVVTLILLIPGGLTLIAVRVRETPLHWLRLLLIPAAVLLVFIILQLTQSTATAELVRLPS